MIQRTVSLCSGTRHLLTCLELKLLWWLHKGSVRYRGGTQRGERCNELWLTKVDWKYGLCGNLLLLSHLLLIKRLDVTDGKDCGSVIALVTSISLRHNRSLGDHRPWSAMSEGFLRLWCRQSLELAGFVLGCAVVADGFLVEIDCTAMGLW